MNSTKNLVESNEDELHHLPPNPGSSEAVALGCLCPVIDNQRGNGIDFQDSVLFWTDDRCKLHGGRG